MSVFVNRHEDGRVSLAGVGRVSLAGVGRVSLAGLMLLGRCTRVGGRRR